MSSVSYLKLDHASREKKPNLTLWASGHRQPLTVSNSGTFRGPARKPCALNEAHGFPLLVVLPSTNSSFSCLKKGKVLKHLMVLVVQGLGPPLWPGNRTILWVLIFNSLKLLFYNICYNVLIFSRST